MIGRVLLAAILAGIAAGLLTGVIQHVRLTPLIIQAERIEMAAAPVAGASESAQPADGGHDHSATGHGATHDGAAPAAEGHDHDANAWAPSDGFERTFYTVLTRTLAAAGFALLLAGVSFLSDIPVTRGNGLVWGLCGFFAVSFAPAIGLPPELPGSAAAGLVARQAWWVGTFICTALAMWIVVTRQPWWRYPAAALLALVPHLIGAPHMPPEDTALPAALAADFVAASMGTNLVMWLLIGLFLAFALNTAKEQRA